MFSMAFDHRIVDGADADRFMADVKKTLETFPDSRGLSDDAGPRRRPGAACRRRGRPSTSPPPAELAAALRRAGAAPLGVPAPGPSRAPFLEFSESRPATWRHSRGGPDRRPRQRLDPALRALGTYAPRGGRAVARGFPDGGPHLRRRFRVRLACRRASSTCDGTTWEVTPTGHVTQFVRDEFGLLFTKGTGPDRVERVASYAPLGARSRELSLAELTDAAARTSSSPGRSRPGPRRRRGTAADPPAASSTCTCTPPRPTGRSSPAVVVASAVRRPRRHRADRSRLGRRHRRGGHGGRGGGRPRHRRVRVLRGRAVGRDARARVLPPRRRRPVEAFLDRCRADRRRRAEVMCGRLQELGLPVSFESVLEEAAGGAVGRPHVARARGAGRRGGATSTRRSTSTSAANSRRTSTRCCRAFAEVADLVHAAGGVVSAAHLQDRAHPPLPGAPQAGGARRGRDAAPAARPRDAVADRRHRHARSTWRAPAGATGTATSEPGEEHGVARLADGARGLARAPRGAAPHAEVTDDD